MLEGMGGGLMGWRERRLSRASAMRRLVSGRKGAQEAFGEICDGGVGVNLKVGPPRIDEKAAVAGRKWDSAEVFR